MERRFRITLISVLSVASLFRIAGLFDDFWLDEIWSLNIATQIRTPQQILTAEFARIDNNHPLNTLFLWLQGDQRHWAVYRTPALVAGIGSVILAAIIMRRIGRVESILAALLTGFSFPLIVFSSEARGYSLAIFFALWAFWLLLHFLDRPGWGPAALFWSSCWLGLVSHLTFVHIYAGLLVWSIYQLARAPGGRVAILRMFQLHGAPLAGCLALYWAFIGHLRVGGTATTPEWIAAVDAIASLVLVPGPFLFELAVTSAVIVGAIWAAVRTGRGAWLFVVVAMILSPTLILVRQALLLDDRQVIAPRYFVVLLPFFLMLMSRILAAALRTSGRGRVLAVLAIGLWVAISSWQTLHFLIVGRGHYAAAVRYIAAHTAGESTIVLSDHPMRTRMVLEFYQPRLAPELKLTIQDYPPRVDAPPADWIVMHARDHGPPDVTDFNDRAGQHYTLTGVFPFYGPSGYTWYLYRRTTNKS